MSAGALMFHMIILCDKIFPWVPTFFYPMTLTMKWAIFWKITLGVRAVIFYISIVKALLWVPILLTLWPWPWSLIYILKTLTLLITFKQWVLELLCFTWVFFVKRLYCGYQDFLICDLDLGFWPIFWIL